MPLKSFESHQTTHLTFVLGKDLTLLMEFFSFFSFQEIHLILKAVLDKCHESLLKAVKTSAASRAEKLDEIREGLLSIQSSGSSS